MIHKFDVSYIGGKPHLAGRGPGSCLPNNVPLGPEAILCLLVPLEFAELSDFCIRKPPYMHLRECRGATVAFRLNGREHYAARRCLVAGSPGGGGI